MKSFASKVAAITGAGSGIGRALALELAARGCHVALSDINADSVAATAEEARNKGVRATSHTVNVADRASVETWAADVLQAHGQVNLVFNNAGVALASTVEDMKYEDLEWLMSINFWGVVYGTKSFLPHLKASGDGHVINISSLFGIMGVPTQGAYNAAKFAVRGFTESLRMELDMEGACVSATSVHPGGIKTNIARAARYDGPAMSKLGFGDADSSLSRFERAFITSPEVAARTILRGVETNARRVLIGPDAKALDLMVRLLPETYQRLVIVGARQSRR